MHCHILRVNNFHTSEIGHTKELIQDKFSFLLYKSIQPMLWSKLFWVFAKSLKSCLIILVPLPIFFRNHHVSSDCMYRDLNNPSFDIFYKQYGL